MPVDKMPVRGAIVYRPEHWTDTQGRASLNVWSAQCQGLRGDSTGQNTKDTHPIPRCMYVCKVICPKVGLSLVMHYQGSAYLSLLDKRKE